MYITKDIPAYMNILRECICVCVCVCVDLLEGLYNELVKTSVPMMYIHCLTDAGIVKVYLRGDGPLFRSSNDVVGARVNVILVVHLFLRFELMG